jgi:competence protein ComEA
MMLYSMLIRLAMVAVTAGIVFWIGWTLPASQVSDSDKTPTVERFDTRALRSTDSLPHSMTASEAVIERPQTPSARPSASLPLDLNLASERELEGLPGIGPVLAVRIVAYREAWGAFQDVKQLRRVKGIGKKTFDRIRTLVGVTSSQTLQLRRKAA